MQRRRTLTCRWIHELWVRNHAAAISGMVHTHWWFPTHWWLTKAICAIPVHVFGVGRRAPHGAVLGAPCIERTVGCVQHRARRRVLSATFGRQRKQPRRLLQVKHCIPIQIEIKLGESTWIERGVGSVEAARLENSFRPPHLFVRIGVSATRRQPIVRALLKEYDVFQNAIAGAWGRWTPWSGRAVAIIQNLRVLAIQDDIIGKINVAATVRKKAALERCVDHVSMNIRAVVATSVQVDTPSQVSAAEAAGVILS